MAGNPPTLSRVRTFRDDFVRAQMKAGQKVNTAPEPKKPKTEPHEVKSIERNKSQTLHIPEELKHSKVPVELTNRPTVKATSTKTKIDIDTSEIQKNDSRRSLMSDSNSIFEVPENDSYAGEGNIITDQKRQRFKLLPAIWESLKDWFGDTEERIEKFTKEKPPIATVRPATDRRSVIEQAAERSAATPKDDYEELTGRLSTTGRKPVSESASAISIKKRSELPPPSWTHVKGETNTTKPVIKPIEQPDVKTEDITEQTVEEPNTPEITTPVTTTTIPSASEEVETLTEEATTEPEIIPEPAPLTQVPEEIPFEEPDTEAEEALPEPAPNTPPPEEPELTPYQPPQAAKTYSTNNLVFSPWRIGAVIFLAVLLGVSFSLWLFGGNGNDSNYVLQNQEESNSLIRSDEKIPIQMGNSSLELQRNILSARPKPTTTIAEIVPVGNIAGDSQVISTEQIMSILDPQASGSFVRNVTDINFGLYEDREPFIVMKVTAFDTAFGGILEWERLMSADLAPLFGAPVNGTFDPQSRSANQIREPYFVDEVIANLDARVLRDETQKERISYAFVGQHIILITTDTQTLRALTNVVR